MSFFKRIVWLFFYVPLYLKLKTEVLMFNMRCFFREKLLFPVMLISNICKAVFAYLVKKVKK